LPLSMLKRVTFLATASVLAVVSVAYVALLLVYDGSVALHDIAFENVKMFRWTYEFMSALPLVCFAFQCQLLVPPIYSEMKQRDLPTFHKVMAGGLAICCMTYAMVGFFGYAKFGADSQGDILLNFADDYVPASIGRLVMAVHVTLAYPLNSFPCRLALFSLLYKGKTQDQIPPVKFYGWTVLMFAVNLVVAILVPEVTVVFSIFGATLGVSLIFLFPAAFAWKISEQKRQASFNDPKVKRWQVGAGIGVVIGVFIAISGTILTLYNLFE